MPRTKHILVQVTPSGTFRTYRHTMKLDSLIRISQRILPNVTVKLIIFIQLFYYITLCPFFLLLQKAYFITATIPNVSEIVR